jgi:putative membrane protein
MNKINLTFSAAALMLALYSCSGENKSSNENSAATDSMPATTSDTSLSNPADTAGNNVTAFALKAAAGGKMEVELGYMAQQKAQSPRVKQFAAMMIKDHSKSNAELMALATAKSILIPSKLPEDIQQHIDEMKKLGGTEFDKHYMGMMTDDHKDDIDQFEMAAKNLKDAEIKAFAAKTLPTLKMHLDSATAIKKDVK